MSLDFETEVFDNGRRGEPRPGCDCMQCFGYCLIDRDAAVRETAERRAKPFDVDVLIDVHADNVIE